MTSAERIEGMESGPARFKRLTKGVASTSSVGLSGQTPLEAAEMNAALGDEHRKEIKAKYGEPKKPIARVILEYRNPN